MTISAITNAKPMPITMTHKGPATKRAARGSDQKDRHGKRFEVCLAKALHPRGGKPSSPSGVFCSVTVLRPTAIRMRST